MSTPRDAKRLIGHEAEAASFHAAWAQGRLHHAWLLSGPRGVGKATFAYRTARMLLAHGDRAAETDLDHSHPVSRQVAQNAAGDMHVLELGQRKDGGDRSEIVIEQVRELGAFLGQTSFSGGWRAVVIDAATDMNRNTQNALLKMLEEPPARTVIFLVNHGGGRLLPTIRSRCRSLRFKPLTGAETAAVLQQELGERALSPQLAALALGQPGLALLEEDGAAVLEPLEAILSGRADLAAVIRFCEGLGGKGGAARVNLFMLALRRELAERATRTPAEALEPLISLWDKAQDWAGAVRGLYMDPKTAALDLLYAFQNSRLQRTA